MRLIFATHNDHKVHEIQEALGGLCEVVSATAAGFPEELPEDRGTLLGNSMQKAMAIFERTGSDCFADDTGLEVEALKGAPGAFSARYAGPQCSPQDNVRKLLEELAGKENRRARFRTIITLIYKGQPKAFEGIVEGEILTEEWGLGGFGYDPIFRPTGYEMSFAQMPLEEKNRISHRGRAIAAMADFLRAQ
ncbi:MAG: non-canonical purine NTP pyrophosphatase, RdgB/HAM1 family [Bacteroidia bacterium]|nr:MAG: non-canonical purine NTP pyrophosphatase, RdgB/HAM1 family [Bacteroidia bacterium]